MPVPPWFATCGGGGGGPTGGRGWATATTAEPISRREAEARFLAVMRRSCVHGRYGRKRNRKALTWNSGVPRLRRVAPNDPFPVEHKVRASRGPPVQLKPQTH